MADQKISAMTAASSVADADITPIVQGGANKKSAFSVIKDYIQGVFDAIYVPLSRVLTIDGVAHDLSTDRSWTSGGVPTARTLTIGGTGHDLSADRIWTTSQILDGIDTPSQGDILIRSNSNWIVLNPSVDGEVLTTHGTSSNPTWTAIPGTGSGGSQLISGGGVAWTGTGFNYIIPAAVYLINGTQYNSPQTPVTLSAADPTQDRIDSFYADTSGTSGVITGTPGSPPIAPSVDPASQLFITFAY